MKEKSQLIPVIWFKSISSLWTCRDHTRHEGAGAQSVWPLFIYVIQVFNFPGKFVFSQRGLLPHILLLAIVHIQLFPVSFLVFLCAHKDSLMLSQRCVSTRTCLSAQCYFYITHINFASLLPGERARATNDFVCTLCHLYLAQTWCNVSWVSKEF